MTSSYVVDTDILVFIQQAGMASEFGRLGRLPVVITDTVWDEFVERPKNSGANPSSVAEAGALALALAGAPTTLLAGTPEAEAFARLIKAPITEHEGELSVIAYAVTHPDHTAVLLDRKALHRGVEELRGRVLSLHGFLDVILKHHALPRAAGDAVSATLLKRQGFRAPLWW